MIGKKLKELIKQRNIPQIKLAKYVNISPSRLSNYLADKREPDLDMLAKIARFLAVDLNYFTDVRFVGTSSHEPTATVANSDPAIIYIEKRMTNSKRRSTASSKLPFPKPLLEGLNVDRLSIYEVHTDLPDIAKRGDYLVVELFSPESACNGKLMILRGRNHRIVSLLVDNGKYRFMHGNMLENADDIANYDIIHMVISRI